MKTKLKCIECGKEYNAKDIRYRCECSNLLEVIPDLKSFNRSGKQWKEHFEKNKDKVAFFRYKDVLLPDLPDNKVISLEEGDTPLYKANNKLKEFFGVDNLYLKHEGMNPSLSFKDRGMVAGVSWANFLGVDIVACASTGDTSASMSAYAANSENLKGVVLLPEGKISFEQLSQPISSGATTLGLDTDFDGCMKLVQELTEKHPIYLLNSMNSFRIEGQKAIGIEMLHQLDWKVPDWIVIPVGNAGNVSALGKGLRELKELGVIDKLPRLAGVETEGANPLYVSYKNDWAELEPVTAKKTVASAIQIGNPVSFKKAKRELKESNGVMEQVSDKEIMDAKAVVDSTGIPICPNSGTAMAGLKKLVDNGVIKKSDKVAVILTAHGAKFSQAIIDYHKSNAKFANKPKSLPANLGAIEKALNLK
jgi:threonine synthase